jgi:hypothetical protein
MTVANLKKWPASFSGSFIAVFGGIPCRGIFWDTSHISFSAHDDGKGEMDADSRVTIGGQRQLRFKSNDCSSRATVQFKSNGCSLSATIAVQVQRLQFKRNGCSSSATVAVQAQRLQFKRNGCNSSATVAI